MFGGESLHAVACFWQNRIFVRSAQRNKDFPDVPIVEWCLVLSMPASFLGLFGGLFWYAWLSSPEIHWILTGVGFDIVDAFIVVLVQCAIRYITDAYASNAGSAVATLAFLEDFISSFLPLAAQSMYGDWTSVGRLAHWHLWHSY